MIQVPRGDESHDERTPLDDIDELVNPAASATPAVATRPAPAARAATRSVPEPMPLPSDERPLFERDLDSVLGLKHAGEEAGRRKPKPATSGADAMSLAPDENLIVISPQKATAFIVIVVILLALSFAAGFLIASR